MEDNLKGISALRATSMHEIREKCIQIAQTNNTFRIELNRAMVKQLKDREDRAKARIITKEEKIKVEEERAKSLDKIYMVTKTVCVPGSAIKVSVVCGPSRVQVLNCKVIYVKRTRQESKLPRHRLQLKVVAHLNMNEPEEKVVSFMNSRFAPGKKL